MSDSTPAVLRVRFSVVEDVRRAIFSELDGELLSERDRARIAGALASRLRQAGLIAAGLEQFYGANDAAALLGRSPEYVVKLAKAGELGACARDGGGWLIPASGLQAWIAARIVEPITSEAAA